MADPTRIRIPLRAVLAMGWRYARARVAAQVRAVSFILIYLAGFQMLVFGSAPAQAWQIAGGVVLVVLGLTFFLEGLFLGLMPLAERVGVGLPRRCGTGPILLFGLLLGIGSTFAEPAVSALRTAGSMGTAWSAPLLYRMLNVDTRHLITAIGAGVGIAVAFGLLRFLRGFSIKPFVLLLVPLLLGVSLWCAADPNLVSILGLAWDAGAVTTGAVTVPLVLALGLGISRAAGKREDSTGGFGIIMLASAFPVLTVMLLGIFLNRTTLPPLPEQEFFSAEHRAAALRLFDDEAALGRHAYRFGGEAARRAFHGSEAAYLAGLEALADPLRRADWLGSLSLGDWLTRQASESERARLSSADPATAAAPPPAADARRIIREEGFNALRAVIPLTVLLLGLLLWLRDRPPHTDEAVLGIVFALIGMGLFTAGIRTGLVPLGDQAGRPLPQVFRSTPREQARVLLQPFDLSSLTPAYTRGGSEMRFFYLEDDDGLPQPIRFDPARYRPATDSYEHVIQLPPLFGPELTLVGIALVFLFAFGMGYGSTLAEPALGALGHTVETLSVGTITRVAVVRTVSLGVGIGLIVGVARMLYDIPLLWLLIPPYLLLLPLTCWSEEDFAGIAWDCGGVTTGGVTVPLVMAMGLGLGGELGVRDGFGILALASVYPILTVLIYGLWKRGHGASRLPEPAAEVKDV